MSKLISKKRTIEQTVAISSYDSKRCSRDCPFCYQYDGVYRCFRDVNAPYMFENIEDFEDKRAKPDKDGYVLKRTESCLKTFGE